MNPNSLIFKLALFYGCRMPNHPRKWWMHEKLRKLLGTPVDLDIDVVRTGLNWSLNPADFEHETLFWTDAKDTWEIKALQARLEPGSVFLDIGANFGYYSIRLAAALRAQIEVHAFEPHPVTFQRLSRHIDLNGLNSAIHAHRSALCDVSGTSRMVGRPDNSGASTLVVGLTGDGGTEVQTTTLDEFACAAGLTRVDVIKIDVEGAEPRVLRGGRETIRKFRPALLVEFWTPGLVRAGSTPAELANALAELGYRMFRPPANLLAPLDRAPDSPDPVNVLCLPE